MRDGDPVYENMRSLLEVMGSFGGSRIENPEPWLSLYDSGVRDAYENYALMEPGRFSGEAVARGLEFFGRTDCPHIWPLFPGTRDEARAALEAAGLKRGDDFQAMTAELGGEEPSSGGHAAKIEAPIKGESGAKAWAELAWRGFDSEGAPPAKFAANAIAMARDERFFLARAGDGAVGMLFSDGKSCGIYYVATIPESRGRGMGGAIVGRLKSRARELGYGSVVLLATPSGRGLYLRHGFIDRGTVEIYSLGA
jgi:GNAT superfamily N-acetyltransferase